MSGYSYPAEIMDLIAQRIDDHQRRQHEQEAGMFWFRVDESSLLIVRQPEGAERPMLYRVSVEPARVEVSE